MQGCKETPSAVTSGDFIGLLQGPWTQIQSCLLWFGYVSHVPSHQKASLGGTRDLWKVKILRVFLLKGL